MIARRRLVIRLSLASGYGVIATGGRRPLPVSGSAPRLPGRSDAAALVIVRGAKNRAA
jgi:hypothetical protein